MAENRKITDAAPAASSPDPKEQSMSLPEHDAARSNREQGLYRKFDVRRTDGSDRPGGKHDGCDYFVLDVTHDPHAKAALLAYARACEATHPQLAADMQVRYGVAASSPEAADERAAPNLREAAAQALEALEGCYGHTTSAGVKRTRAITSLRAALASAPAGAGEGEQHAPVSPELDATMLWLGETRDSLRAMADRANQLLTAHCRAALAGEPAVAADEGRDAAMSERDARRWRFLRSQHEGEAESFHVNSPECEPVGSLPGELDATIDAARAASQDEQQRERT